MDKYDLMSRSKEELITLVGRLMDKLTEKERLEFVSKWISPQAALEEANEFDGNSFIKKVEVFCQEYEEGKYCFEPDYEQYHDCYGDEEIYDYSESEWAEKFTTLLKLAVMYARNKKYDVSYAALDQLLNCLHEAEFDEIVIARSIAVKMGILEDFIETALKSDGYSRHDHLKYTTKSLISRALGSEKNISPDLKEFLQSVEDNKIAGIIDMIKTPLTSEDKLLLLHSAIEMLKQMAQFHINAAKRTSSIMLKFAQKNNMKNI